MKNLLLLILLSTTFVIQAQDSVDGNKLRFKSNEFYDIKFPNKGEMQHRESLVNWTIDLEEQAILIEISGGEPVVIFFEKDELKYTNKDGIVIATIDTEDHNLTFLLGPDNYFKVKQAFKINMNEDGSFNRIFVFTNYPENNLITLLSNQH